jgi:glc operon protein GlcG
MKRVIAGVLGLSMLVSVGAQAQVTTQRESIAFEGAKKIVETCEAMAKEHKWTVAIWVLDVSGQPVYFAANPGAGQIGIETGKMKAQTALLTGAPSEDRAGHMQSGTGALATEMLGLLPLAGGIPLIKDGKVIGAVGAGGGKPENGKSVDQLCVQAGVDAVFKK